MAVSFEWSSLSDVNNFYRKWNDAEHEFHDPKIEAKRKELYVKISTFLNFVSLNTFPNQQYDRQSVPKEWQRDQSERYTNTVRQLNALADEVVQKHQELVRMGRIRLRL